MKINDSSRDSKRFWSRVEKGRDICSAESDRHLQGGGRAFVTRPRMYDATIFGRHLLTDAALLVPATPRVRRPSAVVVHYFKPRRSDILENVSRYTSRRLDPFRAYSVYYSSRPIASHRNDARSNSPETVPSVGSGDGGDGRSNSRPTRLATLFLNPLLFSPFPHAMASPRRVYRVCDISRSRARRSRTHWTPSDA